MTNHADIEFIVVANSEWWAGLTDKQQQIISKAAEHAETDVRDNVVEIEAEAYEIAKANGMTVMMPSASDIEAFKNASISFYDAYKDKAVALGAQLLKAAEGL